MTSTKNKKEFRKCLQFGNKQSRFCGQFVAMRMLSMSYMVAPFTNTRRAGAAGAPLFALLALKVVIFTAATSFDLLLLLLVLLE